MIRGGFLVVRGRRRPYITADLLVPSLGVSGEVEFLVDAGADAILRSP